jgi:hypothetical protein
MPSIRNASNIHVPMALTAQTATSSCFYHVLSGTIACMPCSQLFHHGISASHASSHKPTARRQHIQREPSSTADAHVDPPQLQPRSHAPPCAESALTVRCTTLVDAHLSNLQVIASRSNLKIALDINCKILTLHGDELPANLHAAERRLNLPKRTCTTTDDNGYTIFVNEVLPKPTSPGHDYGRSSQPEHWPLLDPGITPPSPASMSLCRHDYNSSPPLIFVRRPGLQSMTQTLPYTTKYNPSLMVTGLYKYLTQYLTPILPLCRARFSRCRTMLLLVIVLPH